MHHGRLNNRHDPPVSIRRKFLSECRVFQMAWLQDTFYSDQASGLITCVHENTAIVNTFTFQRLGFVASKWSFSLSLFSGIHKFLSKGIVRVGGRSNSEILKQFNLRELSQSPAYRRSLPSNLQSAHNQVGSCLFFKLGWAGFHHAVGHTGSPCPLPFNRSTRRCVWRRGSCKAIAWS